MMDCSKTEVFLAEWHRMCCSFDGKEGKCPVTLGCGVVQCANCRHMAMTGGDIIDIVQEWSDAHQPKTRLSEFLEKYPKTKLYGASELPRFCVADLYGTTCEDMGMVGVGCAECWNTPIDEQGVQ